MASNYRCTITIFHHTFFFFDNNFFLIYLLLGTLYTNVYEKVVVSLIIIKYSICFANT